MCLCIAVSRKQMAKILSLYYIVLLNIFIDRKIFVKISSTSFFRPLPSMFIPCSQLYFYGHLWASLPANDSGQEEALHFMGDQHTHTSTKKISVFRIS